MTPLHVTRSAQILNAMFSPTFKRCNCPVITIWLGCREHQTDLMFKGEKDCQHDLVRATFQCSVPDCTDITVVLPTDSVHRIITGLGVEHTHE